MERIKQEEIASWLLRGFIVFSLIFPAFYSPYTDVYLSAYYGGFSWSYFLLVFYMGLWVIKGRNEKDASWKRWLAYMVILLVYNMVSLFFNYKYLHWYWEQINNTVAFSLFLILAFNKIKLDVGKWDNIRFLIHCIVLSNIGSLIYYILGYTNLLICNNRFICYELPSNFYETRHYWIYSHKSEYALMLVAFVGLFVAYRNKFKNRWTYWGSVLLLLGCLYLTHSWTGVAGVVFIFAGDMMDHISWKSFRLKKSYLPIGGIFVGLMGGIGYKILSERSVLTLGHRTEIWAAVAKVIMKYPQGWGMRFGESLIQVNETRIANNAHNVFMNAALRFSVPAGICFTILFLGIAVYSLVKSKSWVSVGMWTALLILLNMDYSLMSLQMAMLFLIVYLVCLHERKEKDAG